MSFLGLDIPGALAGTLGQVVYDLVLTRRSLGVIDADAIADGAATDEQSYPARGYANAYTVREIDGSRVQQGDQRVTLYPSASMAFDEIEPEPDNVITITTDIGEERLLVVAIEHRAASGALYRLQARAA